MLNEQQRQDLQGIAGMGRNEDTFLAHVAPDEMVIPAQVLRDDPFLNTLIRKSISKYGVDPNQFVVGNGDMDLNPLTGLPEFGFLSKVWKKVKNVVKKAAPVLGAAAMFVPGVGPALGSALGGLGGAATAALSKIPVIGGALSSGASALGGALSSGIGSLGKFVGKIPGMETLGGNLQFFPKFTGEPLSSGFSALGKGIGQLFSPQSIMQQTMGGGMMPGGMGMGYPGVAGGMIYPQQQMYGGGFMPAFYGPYGPSQTQQVQQPQQQQGILDFLSRKLLPQSIEDMIKGQDGTISLGSMFGREGGGLNTLGAAGLAGLLGKVAYESAKERQGGLAATPSVTMDPLGRYQLSTALGTGGTREQFGLGPAPKSLSFNMGGEARQYFSQGGLAMVEELDMRDGGESAGPGTGTSDDIPAMLSDGEYVMTAKATRGAGAYETKKTPTGIELVKTGDPSREAGVENMRELMTMFEAV